ncbi:MAG: hypothetical protein ABIN95_00325 [Mucilaginibacter sp.]
MKRNITLGTIIISAIALSSCSTTKLASSQNAGDDVYNSVAKAADAPVYVAPPVYRDENEDAAEGDGYEDDYYASDDDYYYYDDYASRINRFNYYSPFGYYDNLYYGYSPYGPGLGLGYGGYGGGWGLNIGLGFGYAGYGGYGFSPYWGSPWGYGYGGFGYGGLGYSYWGTGYGGYPYWGVYSAYNNSNPRPYRGSGIPDRGYRPGMTSRSTMSNGRPGMSYPGSRVATGGAGRRPSSGSRTSTGVARPQRQGESQRPVFQPSRPTYSPPSNSGGSFGGGRSSGGGGGGRSSGGGGRGRN